VSVIPGSQKSIAAAIDITSRVEAEEALRRNEEKYRNILESVEDGYFEVDLEGNMTFFNESLCKITGYSKEDLIGLNYREFTLPEISEKMFKVFNQIYLTKQPSEIADYEIIDKNGGTITIDLSASSIKDQEGKVTGFRGIMRDISVRIRAAKERKKLEAHLQQAQQLKALGTLAGGIAHNFNNLLMGIQGNASLALLEMDATDSSYHKLEDIIKLVQSGAKLTTQLLGYARGGRYEIKSIDLNQLVKETGSTFAATRKEISVHTELAADLFGIEADQGQIEQVLLNLFVNAADAMPRGGNLYLKTVNLSHEEIKNKPYHPKPGKYVLLSVADDGIGIASEIKERIFEPFFTTKEIGRGIGLGLASVYGIIKGHGGYIEVESKKGKGAVFGMYLPASTQEIQKKSEKTPTIMAGEGVVLLVDDEEIVLDVSAQILENLGYTVIKARTGKEAVEIYQEHKDSIDITILDMIMPGMGGGEAYDRIREIDRHVKVILSSGYSMDGQAYEILERGCDGFIQKPFNMNQLSQKIQEVLKNNPKEDPIPIE
ncbi:PAS domain S-box protein, partial [Thermodesulfobacteriota bacterium]